ncbi:UDP-N-acetylglucosamine 2-epimerase (non-hydrolyzing) [Candidatus Collierbacteria bacterium]|nr:UDP-N-acetylglucosamine 2-epimerase (non-hydrolyzing) [Candidatus Collierbacteria bacterium]
MKTIVCCYGTRPEFIKIAPVVLVLRKYPGLKPVLICSGQHRELLEGIGEDFGLKPDIELNIRKSIGNTDNLSELTSSLLAEFSKIFTKINPDGVIVQGDAASAAFAAVAAFHQELPIFYIEAGLRTYDLSQPFPEEGYRQMISRIASVLFCPTDIDKKNLLNEGIPGNKIHVVGNTVVDALAMMSKGPTSSRQGWTLTDKTIVVTIHRRENWGVPLKRILSSLIKIRDDNPGFKFIVSVHPNPIVKNVVENSLKDERGFELIVPPNYRKFISILGQSSGVITDSGGIQEEAPSLKIPCLVVREKTERTVGLEAGWSMLAGTNEKGILSGFKWLKDWRIPKENNPYGDGKSALKIAKIIYETI